MVCRNSKAVMEWIIMKSLIGSIICNLNLAALCADWCNFHPNLFAILAPLHHCVTIIGCICNVGSCSVNLLGKVVFLQIIVNCSIGFEHTWSWHKERIFPRTIIKYIVCKVHVCRCKPYCIISVTYCGTWI